MQPRAWRVLRSNSRVLTGGLLATAFALLLAALLATASWLFERQLNSAAAAVPGASQLQPSHAPTAQVQPGAYIARLGNCSGCHTARGGAPFAGGRVLRTPFGTVVSSNLTPDESSGLGSWAADDLWRALHTGRSRSGRFLVPVCPYTHFSHITRADSDALHRYLQSLAPVHTAPQPHALRFPYNTQAALALWRLFHFRPPVLGDGAEPALSGELQAQQRGAYLVQGLGHCGACHAPRNAFGAAAPQLTGGDMPGERWHAPSLVPGGPGQGTAEQTVELLKTGAGALGSVSGPMAAVVGNSLQHWTDTDLQAAVLYLRSLPAAAAGLSPKPHVEGPADPARQKLGAALYQTHCADCHGAAGQGVASIYPALAGNATVLQKSALNLLQVIRHGAFGPSTAANPRPFGMPPHKLADDELAALASYVRRSFGNQASGVSELDVLRLR